MRTHNFQRLSIVLIFLCSLELSAGQYPHKLTVLVVGAKAGTGQAIASLFSSVDNYLKEPVVKQVMSINDAGEAQFVFSELEVGEYAVSVVYDEDGNGKLNTGLLGIPSEVVGFSNNAKAPFGPPSFDKASFAFPHSEKISITLGRQKTDSGNGRIDVDGEYRKTNTSDGIIYVVAGSVGKALKAAFVSPDPDTVDYFTVVKEID